MTLPSRESSTGRSAGRCRAGLRAETDFDAAIELPPDRSVVRRDRVRGPHAARLDARRVDAPLDERLLHRHRPRLGELPVGLRRSGAVGESLDLDLALRLLLHQLPQVVDRLAYARLEGGGAAVEEHVVAERHDGAAIGLARLELALQAAHLRV